MIAAEMTVAQLLDAHPELIEVLASYHPHFKQLRRKLLRRVMAPRVTIAQAARIAGVNTDELLATLRRATGEAVLPPRTGNPTVEAPMEAKPAALPEVPASRQVHLDVRTDIREGREPFAKIMTAVKRLGPDDALVLRTPFEPIPLYDVLSPRGFAHWTECHAPDDWSVWFYRATTTTDASQQAEPRPDASPTRLVDVRGLEPPLPMVRILEEVERLQPGERLEVLHERRPLFLYPQLDERGLGHETDELEPGLVRIVIQRRGAES